MNSWDLVASVAFVLLLAGIGRSIWLNALEIGAQRGRSIEWVRTQVILRARGEAEGRASWLRAAEAVGRRG